MGQLTLSRQDVDDALATLTPLQVLRFLVERRQLGGSVAVADTEPTHTETKLHRVQRIVRQTPEEVRRATTNFVASLADSTSEVVTWIRSDGSRIEHYYGLVESAQVSNPKQSTRVVRALQASLAGMQTTDVGVSPSTDLLSKLGLATPRDGVRRVESDAKCVVAIEGIPSLRADDSGVLDRTLEGVLSVPFDLLILAEPVGTVLTDEFEARLSAIYGQLHAISRRQLSESASKSFSESFSTQVSRSTTIGESTSKGDSTTDSTTESSQEDSDANRLGTALGGLVGAAVGLAVDVGMLGTSAGLGTTIGANLGAQLGRALGGGGSESNSSGTSTQRSEGSGTSRNETTGEATTHGEVEGTTAGQQWTLELVDRQAIAMLEVLDRHFDRVRRARSFGLWITKVFLVTSDEMDARVVANALSASIRGDDTHLEPIRTVVIRDTELALRHLRAGQSPRLNSRAHPFIPGGEQFGSLLTSDELALWFAPPTEDIPGIPARPSVRFGSNVPAHKPGTQTVELGDLVLWNQTMKSIPVSLPTADLCSHTLVVGTTGSGKTTTVRTLLLRLQTQESPVPFMLLEPAKSEYEDLYDELRARNLNPLRVGVRDDDDHPLRFNPFVAPEGIPLSWYVDGLKILLRACFSMQESLPQLLERLILDAYTDFGWSDSGEIVRGQHSFPDFRTLLHRSVVVPAFPRQENGFRKQRTVRVDGIRKAVHSLGYDPRAQATLSAALRVRAESFTRGLKGQVFRGDGLPLRDWLARPVFVSLSDIKDPDIRRFMLGAIFLQLYAHREVEARTLGKSKALRHLVVMEEAHHLLENVDGHGPGAELVRESNRLVANSLAELRVYGQGIVVIDQSPTALDPSVLRNTNTKIIHRMLFEADCVAAGNSIGLDEERIKMLRSLGPGDAVLSSASLAEPVAVHFHQKRT